MATLLRDPKINNYDILAIQEPWKNPFNETTHHPAKDEFHLYYPTSEEEGPSRVCFFVNRRLNHSNWSFKQSSKNLYSLILNTNEDPTTHVTIHNVYNPRLQDDGRPSVLRQLRATLKANKNTEQIAVGDYNLHHEL
jgi:exonuclease III